MERQPVAERQLHWTLAIARKLGEIKTQDGKKRNPSRQNTGICQLLRARERAALVALRKSGRRCQESGPPESPTREGVRKCAGNKMVLRFIP